MSIPAVSPICRATDFASGHGCYPPEEAIQPLVSKDTFVEGQGVLRHDDKLGGHCCRTCHQGTAVGSTNKTFVNNQPLVRLKDKVVCSPTTVANGRTYTGGATQIMITSAIRTFSG